MYLSDKLPSKNYDSTKPSGTEGGPGTNADNSFTNVSK